VRLAYGLADVGWSDDSGGEQNHRLFVLGGGRHGWQRDGMGGLLAGRPAAGLRSSCPQICEGLAKVAIGVNR